MHMLERKLKKAEGAYEKKKNGANALALFACYIFAGRTIETEGIYLSKAYHVAVTAHKEDVLDLKIISAALYANMLLENYDSAYEIIRRLDSHSSFLSKNEPLLYGQFLYFYSVLQTKSEKARSAKKMQKNLELLYEKTELTPLIAYLGSIQRLVYDDVSLCAKMYYEAMRKGLRSVFFLLDVYDILIETEIYSGEMNELAKCIIPWALNRDLPVEPIIERLEKRTLIGVLFSLSSRHLAKIYETYGHMGAFQCLCQKLIFEGDVSKRALAYYTRALEYRLNLRGLEQISIKSAYENKYYRLPLSVIEEALKTPSAYGARELAFLFGTLANEYADTEAFGEQRENAVKFGMWALSKEIRGIDYNLVYKYLFDIFPENERLCEIISEELFRFEIEFGEVAPDCVCVCDDAKNGMYAFSVEANRCYVNAIGDFKCYFMAGDTNEYLSINDYKITKTLEGTSAELYKSLFERGYKSPELLIALAYEYLKLSALTRESIEYLQMAAGLDIISLKLKNEICLKLAGHYASLEQYSLAVHYFTLAGERGLKPENAENALNTYIATGRFTEALSIIEKYHITLSDTVVFNSLRSLHEYADSLEIAELCYNLILDGLCAAEILGIVFKYFRGTPEEWLLIANKIDMLGFDVTQLYEKIIINGIFSGSIGNACNEAFTRLYACDKKHSVITKYVYFCCYETLRNGKKLPSGVIDILAEMYREDDSDELLCCALAINYIRDGRRDKLTLISEAATLMEEAGVILPEFKSYQDKSFICSYIEKNTPFIYYQTAHRNVVFRYKTEEMSSFAKKKANYFRFGIYAVNLPLFYGEKLTYYFEEENGAKTEPQTYTKTHMRLIEQFSDPFYTVNNARIYEHMMKFDLVEELIENELGAAEQFPIITL